MRNLFIAVLLFSASKSYGAIDWDGCYQLYLPGSMHPAVCIDGTNEEGINGAGVRLVIFRTNTDVISACGLSSSLQGTQNSLEFMTGSTPQMILKNVEAVASRLEGDATFGKTNLKFLKIDAHTTKRLLNKFYSEQKCRNLNMGSIVKLN